jgi:DNA-binding NtrC family response regulator
MADTSSNGSVMKRRILVVDDDATIRLLCTKLLKEAGYQVLEAEGSPEAMALLAASGEPIDLILVDLFLPPPDFQLASGKSQYQRVNGHEMVPQMLAMKKELRVVYMSSHPRANLAAQHIALDGASFLQKPLSKDALLAQVAAALEAPPLRLDEAAGAAKKDVQWVD